MSLQVMENPRKRNENVHQVDAPEWVFKMTPIVLSTDRPASRNAVQKDP
jgi:hypothetical protein